MNQPAVGRNHLPRSPFYDEELNGRTELTEYRPSGCRAQVVRSVLFSSDKTGFWFRGGLSAEPQK